MTKSEIKTSLMFYKSTHLALIGVSPKDNKTVVSNEILVFWLVLILILVGKYTKRCSISNKN